MKAPAIFSALLTIGAVIYLLLTQWTFWKDPDDRPEKAARQTGPATGKTPDTPDTPDTPAAPAAGQAKAGPDTSGVGAPARRRTGTTHYEINAPCDCVGGMDYFLETVTIDDTSTKLTVLNTRQKEITTYPPGHEHAQYLLEGRYVNGSRPRHALIRTEGIGQFPASTRSRRFQLVFPRIADEVDRLQLGGHSTGDLVQFHYTTIMLDREIDQASFERAEAYKQCGFDGVTTVAAGHTRAFVAHGHYDASGHRWSIGPGARITGSSAGTRVTVEGQNPGRTELCLTVKRGGASCESCRDIEVGPATEAAPDFSLQTCGGMPSRSPHWQFEIASPTDGTRYEWSVSAPSKIAQDSKTSTTLVMRPAREPGSFSVTLRAIGESASSTMTLHSVYSCPVPGPVK